MGERPTPREALTPEERRAEYKATELADKNPEKKSEAELKNIEQEQQEALRFEKEVDQLARDLTELWRKDDGRALRFKSEEQRQLRAGNEEYYDATRHEHDKIVNKLQAKLVEMHQSLATIQERAEDRFDTIARMLGGEKYFGQELGPAYRRAGEKKGTRPANTEELLRQRFPFINKVLGRAKEMRIYVDEGQLLEHYGYTERGAQGNFARKKEVA